MPTVTVTMEPQYTPPRAVVSLSWGAATQVRVFRRDPDRSRPVRGCEPLQLTGATATVHDYEVPFGVGVCYEAVDDDGQTAVSATVNMFPTAFYPNDQGWSTSRGAVWLRHLTNPRLSMPIDLANAESPVFKQSRTVLDVLNRPEPVVLTDGNRKTFTTTLDVRTWSLEEADRLRALLADNTALLLSVPPRERWGLTSHYIAVGDVTEDRLWQEWAEYEGRVFHLPVEIVERPVGGKIYADCSYWSAQQSVASYLDLAARYNTYAQLATCTPATAPGTFPPGGVTYTQLLDLTAVTSQGVYPAPTRRVTLSGTLNVTQGRTYHVRGTQWLAETTQPTRIETRYQYGTQVGPTIGLTVGASQPRTAGPEPELWVAENSFLATSTGIVTVVLTVVSDGGARDLTDVARPRTLEAWTDAADTADTPPVEPDPGGSSGPDIPDGWVWNGAGQTVVTTPGGTYPAPVQVVTVTGTFDVFEGSIYLLSGWQRLTSAPSGLTMELRYQYGPPPNATTGVAVASDFDTAPFDGNTGRVVYAEGTFTATSDGTIGAALVLRSTGQIVDATTTDNPRCIVLYEAGP